MMRDARAACLAARFKRQKRACAVCAGCLLVMQVWIGTCGNLFCLEESAYRIQNLMLSECWSKFQSAQLMAHVDQTCAVVSGWHVRPAQAHETDRAIVVNALHDGVDVKLLSYAIRASLYRVGPLWGLQIFYCSEAVRRHLSIALGDALAIVWTPVKPFGVQLASIVSREEYQWLLLSHWYWEAMEIEHVLIVDHDGWVLRCQCVDSWLQFAYVGAPWSWREGGNGGFSLRRTSAMLQVLDLWKDRRCPESRLAPEDKMRLSQDCPHEDLVLSDLLMEHRGRNGTFPERKDAIRFSVETVSHVFFNENYSAPCGFHKMWEYLPQTFVKNIFATADMNC